MILVIFFLFGFIQCVSSIKCFTCNDPGSFCSLPLDLGGGEDDNINDIESFYYDPNHACQSDHYIDQKTGQEKIILRGTHFCKELDVINHRTYCCYTDNCNKWLPPMQRQDFIYSNNQRYLPSIILIGFSIFLLAITKV